MSKLPTVIGLTALLYGIPRFILVSTIVIVSLSDAIALRFDYGTGASMSYSDNITQTSENEEDWVGSGIVGVSLEQDSGPLIIDASALIRYEDFVNDTFNDRLFFSLNNQAEWRIAPERFSWMLENYFTQVSIDPIDPATPDNTQNANAFSSGPNLVLRLGALSRLEAGLRYDYIYYEESDADNLRYSAFASWLLTPASPREYSLNLSGEKVDFTDDDLNENFTREDYTLAFATQFPRYSFRAELGGTSIQSDRSDDFGYLARVAWTRNLTNLSTIAISAASQLTDTGRNLLQADASLDQANLQTEEVSADIFRQKEVSVAYITTGDPLRGELTASWIDRDYENAPLDRLIKGVVGSIEYNITATLVGKIFAEYDRIREFATKRVDKDSSVGIGLIYLIRRDLSLEMTAQYFNRNSNLPGGSYREVSGLLGIAYGVGAISG